VIFQDAILSENEAKFRENAKCENFAKMQKAKIFVKTMSFIVAKINCSKRTCGILCSDSSIF